MINFFRRLLGLCVHEWTEWEFIPRFNGWYRYCNVCNKVNWRHPMKTKPETTMHDLICIGQQMSNIIYNLAQKDEFKKHRETLNEVRKQWDETRQKLNLETPQAETFWLARDKESENGWEYGISKSPMTFGKHWPVYCSTDCRLDLRNDYRQLLGLPTLRKGQQVQIRRTNNGFEIVKGNKDGQ